MSEEILMPALGESVTEGTVTRWLKSVGDEIAVDEPLLEVATDKVDTEVPSPVAGTVLEILVEEDETVSVGTVLARIGAADEAGAGGAGDDAAAQDSADDAGTDEAPAQDAPAAAETTETEAEETPAPAEPAEESAPQAPAEPAAEAGSSSPATGTEVTLPALGESVTDGTITRWLKAVGDAVEEDEPLFEVSTDKVDTEVPSPAAGTLLEIRVNEDETADVGTVVAIIGSADAAPAQKAPEPAGDEEAAAEQPAPAQPAESAPAAADEPAAAPASAPAAPQADAPAPAKQDASAAPAAQGSYLTPLVRKLAAEKGVDTSTLTGTGVGGRIRKEDVLEAAAKAEEARKAAEAAQAAPAPAKPAASAAPAPVSEQRGTTEKMTRLRKIVAERMVESLQTMAQLTTVVEVDVTKVAMLRAKAKAAFEAREGAKLTYLPFFTLAAVEALKTYPKINATIGEDEITYHGSENVGIAVDTERGLVVPVIRDAGDLNLAAIAKRIADLGARTRANKVSPDELSGGTFTITNTGSGGALFDTPIVPSPQVAILGTGTITRKPVVVTNDDGTESIGIRHMCYLSLSYDHRLVDGADAARFLMAVKKRIEEGAFEDQVGL